MFTRFRLFHKGLILVMVPLLAECVFISVLFNMVSEAEKEIKHEQRARQVVTHLNTILRLIMAGAAGVRVEYKGVQADRMLEYRQREEFAKLEILVKDDKKSLQKVKAIKKLWNKGLSNYRKVREYAIDGEAVKTYRKIEDMKLLYKDTYYSISKAIEEAESLEKNAPHKSKEIREKIRQLLILGLVLNIAIAIALTWYLNLGTTRRLSILMDNTQRIAAGEKLHEPLSGTDEISELDKFLASMAITLEESSNKEKDALERVKQSESRIRMMLETIPSGVIVAEKDGTIQYVNPLMSELIGIPQLKFDKQPVSSFLKLPRDLAACSSPIKENSEDQFTSTKTLAIKNDGDEFPVEVIIKEFEWTEGNRYLIALADITEREKLETMKQEFISMVTHDVRSPLNALSAFLELLDNDMYGSLNDNGRRKLKMAESNIDLVIRLISDLLDLDKIEAGLLDLNIKTVEASNPVDRAIDTVKSLAERKEVKIIPTVSNCTFKVDEDRLVQVLVNLLSNAIKYSPDQGEIKLEIFEEKPWIKINVTDQGPGIPLDQQKRVFDRFAQVKGTRQKGTSGLGLAIAKALIEQHGGTIGVKSQEGEGSTFWILLPA